MRDDDDDDDDDDNDDGWGRELAANTALSLRY